MCHDCCRKTVEYYGWLAGKETDCHNLCGVHDPDLWFQSVMGVVRTTTVGLWRNGAERTGYFKTSSGGVPKRLKWRLSVRRGMRGAPVVAGDNLFISSQRELPSRRGGYLYRISLKTRSVHRFRGTGYYEPSISGERVVICRAESGGDNRLVCLDWRRNAEVWQSDGLSGFVMSPLIVGDWVFIADFNSVRAFRLASGKPVWQTTTGAVASGPCQSATTLIVNTIREGLFAYVAATGRLKWRTVPPHAEESYATPCICRDRVIVVSKSRVASEGHVSAFRLEDGQRLWSQILPDLGDASPACDGRRIFTVGLQGTVSCLDIQDGRVLWASCLQAGSSCSPSVAGASLYIGDNDGWLYTLDTRTGRVRWRYRTGDAVFGSPWVVSNQVIFASSDGYLYCFDL
ncbi:PQQ-like domain-containing protein [Armatimonadetes bacterium DC]|nr:PQQ-like domain-containing protein [Armatimonadetes bacterium DC]